MHVCGSACSCPSPEHVAERRTALNNGWNSANGMEWSNTWKPWKPCVWCFLIPLHWFRSSYLTRARPPQLRCHQSPVTECLGERQRTLLYRGCVLLPSFATRVHSHRSTCCLLAFEESCSLPLSFRFCHSLSSPPSFHFTSRPPSLYLSFPLGLWHGCLCPVPI